MSPTRVAKGIVTVLAAVFKGLNFASANVEGRLAERKMITGFVR